MIQTFEESPDWSYYGNTHATTQNLEVFFDKKSKYYAGTVT